MPIGKNALKRVNNGYSNVTTKAPDMENSVVEPEMPKSEKKAVAKKPTEKSAPKTAPKSSKGAAAPKPQKKAVKEESGTHPDGFVHIGFGDELPVYLL